MRRRITLFLLVVVFACMLSLISIVSVSAINENCGAKNKRVHQTCANVKYKDLPSEVKYLMKKLNCDVKTGSVYDYGHALDLNGDGNKEYAFCCEESPHGPCGMKIFGKVSGKWKEIFEYMYGFGGDDTPCFGFVVLNDKNEGYYDICVDDEVRGVLKFKGGRYKDFKITK